MCVCVYVCIVEICICTHIHSHEIVKVFVKNEKFGLLIVIVVFKTIIAVMQSSDGDDSLLEFFLKACWLSGYIWLVVYLYSKVFKT